MVSEVKSFFVRDHFGVRKDVHVNFKTKALFQSVICVEFIVYAMLLEKFGLCFTKITSFLELPN